MEANKVADLYGEMGGQMRAWLNGHCPADDVDDVMQAAFMRLAQHEPQNPAGYVMRSMHHALADLYRSRKHRPQPLDVDACGGAGRNSMRPHEAAMILADLMDRYTTDDERQALRLTLAGYGDVEIGRAMGRTDSAINALKYRACRRMRAHG